MSVYSYPAPKAPQYKKPDSVDDCLPQARIFAEKEYGRAAMGPIHKGDNALIITLPDQDPYVQEAVTEALKEKGAESVKFMYEHELSGGEPRAFSAQDGWREANTVENEPWDMSGSTFYSDIIGSLLKHLVDNPKYNVVFFGLGGRNHFWFQLGEHSKRYRGCWLFNNWEEFLSEAWTHPDELWKETERKIIKALGTATAVRITDPEGTHLEYTLTPEEAKRWELTAWLPGHLLLDPLQSTTQENAMIPVTEDVPPVFRDLNGVLAGTSNHMGYLPRIELHFEHGRLVDVKGGGRYGEMIRELQEKHRDVHWPGYPDKGFFWYCDCALCTVVKAFRRTSDLFNGYWRLPNISERNRAGVFHMGMGSRRHGSQYLQYAKENHLSTGHIHVHNYFATYEIKVKDSGYWHKIVDKGRLTALDDVDIRALAVKYGDPDKLLSYNWVPPLPGINCEGNYWTDYAPDPAGYIKKRIAEGKPV